MPAKLNINPGDRFGHLTVLGFTRVHKRSRMFMCECDCGTVKEYWLQSLTSQNKGCGCVRRRVFAELMRSKSNPNFLHGESRKSTEYKIWASMLNRCSNENEPAYANYGGRGIIVCPEWKNDFPAFLRDMGRRPAGATLDRVDNDGPYSPDNCRWATRTEQANNKRSNRILTHNGRSLSIAQWSRETGISQSLLRFRIEKGWNSFDALTKAPMTAMQASILGHAARRMARVYDGSLTVEAE